MATMYENKNAIIDGYEKVTIKGGYRFSRHGKVVYFNIDQRWRDDGNAMFIAGTIACEDDTWWNVVFPVKEFTKSNPKKKIYAPHYMVNVNDILVIDDRHQLNPMSLNDIVAAAKRKAEGKYYSTLYR